MDILDFNHCHHKTGCDCGWNVTFGSKSEVELMKLKEFVKSMIEKDMTNYQEKFSTEKFLKSQQDLEE